MFLPHWEDLFSTLEEKDTLGLQTLQRLKHTQNVSYGEANLEIK